MQQDNTDKILQRMESQQLPDLSQMDKHWEDMQQLLEATIVSKPVVQNRHKWLAAATVLLIVGLIGWAQGWFSAGNNNKVNIQELIAKPVAPKQIDTSAAVIAPVTIVPTNNPLFVFTTGVPFPRIASSDTGDKKSAPIIINSPIVTNAPIIPATLTEKQTEQMNAQLMQQFWSQVEKKPQQFIIDNRYDMQLQGAEGTSIKIPANAFPNAGDGKITIELTEFYDYADMIANKLTSSSYQRQLVSDGMLRIRAMQKGKEIQMTGLKPMGVNMPRRDMNNEMQLFAGEWKSFIGNPKLINWIPLGQQQNYQYYLGDGSANAVLHPYAIHKRWFSKKKVVKYSLDNDKSMSVSVTKKLIEDAYENEIIVKVKKRMPAFHRFFSMKLPKEYWEYNYQLPSKNRQFYARGSYGYDTAELRRADSLQGRYNFSVTTTGWINCDRFSNDKSPRVEFTISGNKDEKVYCSYLVFKDIKSVLPGYADNNKCTFYDIPAGKDVTLITLGISHGKTICSMREMKTAKGDITGVRFEETDPENFKQRLVAMKW